MPRPDEATKELFRSVVPDDPEVTVRPMFGNLAAFVGGTMFTGLYGPDLFVRLPDQDREALTEQGGAPFEPMPGRPMREYLLLPAAWRDEPERIEEWVARSLAWARGLPPKARKRS
ncbi:MAG: TfoX/Sxy family protein [Actinobacteria bacterium]|nr:TfoX/Sxy family protein [Actinomycetota bacterium]